MNITDQQIALLKLCIEHNLNFQTSPKHGLIEVKEFDQDSEYLFNEWIYTDGRDPIKNLNSLIEKVQNHVSAKMETA